MRVRIQYSVDLDEIPQKISEFLQNSVTLIGEAQHELQNTSENLIKGRVSEHSLEMIDNVRQELAKVDMMLADSHSILFGYVQAKNPPPEVHKPEAPDVIPEG